MATPELTRIPNMAFGVYSGSGSGSSPAPSRPAPDFASLAALVNQADINRIPMGADLETASSSAIAALLNPPSMFPDVNRQAAELGASRGVRGSAAAYGTGLRLTDEERLRRIALGEQLLSGAYGRREAVPDISKTFITPAQQAQIDLENRRQNLAEQQWEFQRSRLNTPSFTYSGGGGGGRAPAPIDTRAAAYTTYPSSFGGGGARDIPYILPTPGMDYPDPSGPLLPLFPGGPTPGGDYGGDPVGGYGSGYGEPDSPIVPGLDMAEDDILDFLYYGG
jgi:hypothetical protein